MCLSREAGPVSRAITKQTFPSTLWQIVKKSSFFFFLNLSSLPVPLKQRKSLPFGAASSYLNLEKLGEGSYATVYKGISR